MTTTESETPQGEKIGSELASGKFTEEMLTSMRNLIGTELRTDACVNNEYATRLAILRFAEGIGDDNPLWTDEKYAEAAPSRGSSPRRASSSPVWARSRSAGAASAASTPRPT